MKARSLSCALLLLPLLWCLPPSSHGGVPITWDDARLRQMQALSDSKTWRALLHYYPAPIQMPWADTAWVSQADDNDFFLAAEGKHDPAAELRATIEAFYRPVDKPDAHPVCRFPARWHWLQAQMALPAAPLSPQACPEWVEWHGIIKPHSITLVFASSYLNSPSSMFGHTFLRIDPENISQGSTWLSFAVNFGAEYRADDNSIMYAWKGVLGGYPGFFSVLRYHEKINEYNRIENRDLWEYRLNLSPQETAMLVEHLWELRNIDFDYYFFDENCSFRLLELLELARPTVELTDGFGVRAIPIDTARAVLKSGLVDDVDYRTSKATDLQFQASRLNDEHQQMAWEIASARRPLTDPALLALPAEQRAQVLRVAYKYLRYEQDKGARDDAMAALSLDLLRALRLENAGEPMSPPRPAAPESGHDTLLTGFAAGRVNGEAAAELRLRSSYHDLADNALGYLDGAAINIGELVLRQREQHALQVEMANLIDINSHAPQNLWFSPLTWRVKAGADRVYAEHDDALAARVAGGAGITRNVGGRHLLYGMGMARIEHNPLLEDNMAIGAGALAGALFYGPAGTLQLEADHYHFSDGHERAEVSLIQNVVLDRNNAMRVQARHRKQLDGAFDEIFLEYRHFFY